MCSYFIVGNKIFCFFKKWVFALWDEGTFQGRVSNSRGGRGGAGCPPILFFLKPLFFLFIFSKFAGLQAESRQLYYQMNSFTGIFDSILSPPLLPPCIDVSPPPMFWTQHLWETLQGGNQVLQNFDGVAHNWGKKGGGRGFWQIYNFFRWA